MTETPQPPRFEVRWSNGAWKLFDTHNYCSVDVFRLQVYALEAAWLANAQAAQEARHD